MSSGSITSFCKSSHDLQKDVMLAVFTLMQLELCASVSLLALLKVFDYFKRDASKSSMNLDPNLSDPVSSKTFFLLFFSLSPIQRPARQIYSVLHVVFRDVFIRDSPANKRLASLLASFALRPALVSALSCAVSVWTALKSANHCYTTESHHRPRPRQHSAASLVFLSSFSLPAVRGLAAGLLCRPLLPEPVQELLLSQVGVPAQVLSPC